MNHNKTAQAMLYLIRCALHSVPPQPLDEIDYEQLYKLSAFHSVEAMVAMALESGGLLTEDYTDSTCIEQWKEAKIRAIRKVALLDNEREAFFRYFEEQGIWYLPLKGILLKDMYPMLGMRQMADNDILFDRTYQHQLKAYMESRGYKTESFAQGNHDVYQKPPVYNFEFHTALFPNDMYFSWVGSEESLKRKLIKDSGNCFGYHFSDEDFYIHLILHGYNHYRHGAGTGIRFLIDIYVFLSKKQNTLNWEYVSRELAAVNVQNFESNTRILAQKLFDINTAISLMETEEDLMETLIRSGTYGTALSFVENRLNNIQKEKQFTQKKVKLYYLLKRVFPGKEFIMRRYPFCRKHPWSIPFCWFLRLMNAVFLGGKRIWNEIRVFRKIK